MPIKEEALECFNLYLIWDSGQSSEDQKADRNAANKDHAWEISVKNEDYIGCWTPDCVCYPSPETEIKGNGLIFFF